MRKTIRLFGYILLIVGIVIFIYPFIYRVNFNNEINKDIEVFNKIIKNDEQSDNKELNKLYVTMSKYNEDLFLNGQMGLSDQMSFEESDFDLKEYGIDNDILGFISIPKINTKLPIYNGARESYMENGAVYLNKTSLPIGGNNTNSVIAAHLRHKGIDMFRYLIDLDIDDDIFVTNYFETLHYRVIDTKIINPEDINEIYIKEDKDLITLSTCHPYPKDTQRYIVYGERVYD